MDSCTLEVFLCNPAGARIGARTRAPSLFQVALLICETDPRISTGMQCFNCLRPNVESDSDPVRMTSQGEAFSVHELLFRNINRTERVRTFLQEHYLKNESKVITGCFSHFTAT